MRPFGFPTLGFEKRPRELHRNQGYGTMLRPSEKADGRICENLGDEREPGAPLWRPWAEHEDAYYLALDKATMPNRTRFCDEGLLCRFDGAKYLGLTVPEQRIVTSRRVDV